MSTSPFIIENVNLSQAWIVALKKIVDHGGKEICPLVVSLNDFTETAGFRQIINQSLNQHKLPFVETVSETIFPLSLYEYEKFDRHRLYKRYEKNLARIKGIDPRANGNGTYFERMIAFKNNNRKINQLEIIISSLLEKKVKRRSKLQAAIFDPTKDHTNKPFQGFPCLQHVTFYKSDTGGLVLNSFYAIQYLYRRGYGNWLGLINLGKFVAQETGLEFERFTCFIGVEQLDELNKHEAKKLLIDISAIIPAEA